MLSWCHIVTYGLCWLYVQCIFDEGMSQVCGTASETVNTEITKFAARGMLGGLDNTAHVATIRKTCLLMFHFLQSHLRKATPHSIALQALYMYMLEIWYKIRSCELA